MRNTTRNISLLTWILLLFSYCNNKQQKKTLKEDYNKIEVYCWCFTLVKGDFKNGSHAETCETFVAVKPSDLIRTGRFIYASKDTTEYTALSKLFFNSGTSEGSARYSPDSRFLILLRNKNASNDTIVYRSDDTFVINSKNVFKYPFNVLDSVRRILNKDVIDCPENSP